MKEENSINLLENVRFLCREAGISVPKLEKELGFSNGSMYNWGKNSPSIDRILQVANYFGKSLDFIVYGINHSKLDAVNHIRLGEPVMEITLDEVCSYTKTLTVVLPDDVDVDGLLGEVTLCGIDRIADVVSDLEERGCEIVEETSHLTTCEVNLKKIALLREYSTSYANSIS